MKIKELLSTKDKWVKGNYAQTADGEGVYANDPKAAKYCLMGAVHKCYNSGYEYQDVVNKLKKTIATLKHKNIQKIAITDFNDSPRTKFSHIRKVLKMADV